MNTFIRKSLSSKYSNESIDMGPAIDLSSITAFLSKHAETAAMISDGIKDYSIPSLNFLRLTLPEKRNILRSFEKNIVLNSQLLTREDRLPRKRYASMFISPLFQEFPDRGLMKSCLFAFFKLRAQYPDSAYAAQIGQSYLEYAFFAYGVYFETKGRILSLRSFENLLEAFDKYGVEFTDGIKLYQLQTFIEKTAQGQSPFYFSERQEFEDKYNYSEDDFRAIPSERIFPMEKFDPEDWKAALEPLEYDKSEANRFRLVAREFIESRDEIDSFVSEREFFRFQNVSCAQNEDASKSTKLRQEVRKGYEMDDNPFQFKRTLINVSTSNYRDSWVNTPASRKKLKYFEILTRRMIRNVPEIPDGDMENDGFVNNLRFTPDRTYVMGDLKKWGITFPVYLIRIFCEEAEKRFPFGWIKLVEQLEQATLWVDGKPVRVGTRGFGLGNLNYISSVIHYLILKMTNCEKFIVRSDDSLTVYRNTENPYYEIYLKEKLGFIVNRKKVNISSKANVFCENYAEIESKFQTQLYEKFGYMTGQIGQVLRKTCNSVSSKFYISQACDINIPAKSLIDLLVAINYMIFGPEFDSGEIKLDHFNGGWTKKYYSTNLNTEYIALENDLESVPEYTAMIKALYHNKLHAVAPANHAKKAKELYPLLKDKLFPFAQCEKEILEQDNILVPFTTPYEYVWGVNDQLSDTQRLNKNAHLRTKKWVNLERSRRRKFNKIKIKDYYDFDLKEILLERIEENFLKGKGGYAIPYSIFEDEEYDTSAQIMPLGANCSSEGYLVRTPKKPVSLEEEDRQMTEFLKEIRQGRLPVDIPRFDLWKESKHVLYSMNEYNNSILVNENFSEIIKKNEKTFALFNIPTEIAYFDWCTRLTLKGDVDIFRTNFSIRKFDKEILYDPRIFKRYSSFPGPDPKRITYYGCHFYVNQDEYQIITSGLKLMKYQPEYELELSNLFNLLYKEGEISPSFLAKREELIVEHEAKRQELIRNHQDASDDDVLIEMLQWRSAMAASTMEESLTLFSEEMLLRELKLFQDANLEEQVLEVDEDRLLDLFSDSELQVEITEEETFNEDDFDFSYDYFDSSRMTDSSSDEE